MGSDIWVVGESFARATVQPELETAAGLMRSLRETPPDGRRPVTMRPGLGVDEVEWSTLCQQLVKEHGAGVLPVGEPPRPVSRHGVLKHQAGNVLVGDARIDAGGAFTGWLSVANDTEMLRDHTADQQHVPGMLVIEAVLQLVTWAVGEHVPPGERGEAPYAVMHGVDLDFRKFVFPIAARLSGELKPAGEVHEGKVPLVSEVSVWQAGRECSTARVRLHAFAPRMVFAVEEGQVRGALERAVEDAA
ncbi:AfsA-related hotdog domain-containing protein [Streptomyces sp. TR06-5]|uniref:AfsA-related hotdog domain-containing protein n=1 Tax=unclassified Streptomyces TaxID=2593676 RepID=UPI0039A0CCFA